MHEANKRGRCVIHRRPGEAILIGETRVGIHSISDRIVDTEGRVTEPGIVVLEIAGALLAVYPARRSRATLWVDAQGIRIYRLDDGEAVELP